MDLAVVIRLSGIGTVLYGGCGEYVPEAPYEAVNCVDLESIGSFTEEMPKFGGVAKPSGFSFRLAAFEAIDLLFSRSIEGVRQARLRTTLLAEEGTSYVQASDSEDVARFDSSGVLYIGQETIAYSAKNNGLARFTVAERGYYGSPISEHLCDSNPARSWKPAITQYPVFWKGREATVSVHEVYSNGRVAAAGFQVLRGFINAEPDGTERGFWRLSVVQDTGRFDQQLGDTRYATTLVEGYHYFDGQNARRIRIGEWLPRASCVFEFIDTGVTAAVAAADLVPVNSVQAHKDIFDTARGTYAPSPLNGPLCCPAQNLFDLQVEGYSGNQYDLTTNVTLRQGESVVNDEIETVIDLDIAPSAGLQRWPEDAIAVFNEAANVTLTAGGLLRFVDVALSADGATLLVQCGFPYNERQPPTFMIYRYQPQPPSQLWFPLLRISADVLNERGRRFVGSADQQNAETAESLDVRNVDTDEESDATVPMIPASLGFYQPGEQYLLLRDRLFASISEDAPSVIVARKDNGAECSLEVDQVEPIEDDSFNFVGYRYRVTDFSRRDPSVFPLENTADSKVSFVPYIAFSGEDLRRVLLKVLLSGYSSVPGYPDATYSVLPTSYGLRCRPDAVDVEGILAFPVPPVLRQLQFKPIAPVSARELFDPLLQSQSAALVPANIGGARKLTLVRARQAAPLLADGTILDSDWLGDERPGKARLDETYSVFRISSNYDPATDKFQATAQFDDMESFDAYGSNQAVDIKIRGLQLLPDGVAAVGAQAHAAFIAVYKNLRASGAFALQVFTGGVSWLIGRSFSVGKTLNVTIADGRDGNGEKTIVSVPMQVRSLTFDVVRGTVRVDLLFRGQRLTSIAPSAEVESVIDEDRVYLKQNDYSDLRHPSTGAPLADWFFFAQSDGSLPFGGTPVRLVKTGAEEGNSDGLITALDMDTGEAEIEAHGLVAGDRIRPRSWDSAAAFHKVYAFVSELGKLGAGDDPGFQYS